MARVRRREVGVGLVLVGDDEDFGAFAVATALPVFFCFLDLAGIFFVVVAVVAASEELPPRRVKGAFLLLLLLPGFFETDAIGGDDVFETVAAFAFAPAAATLPYERVLCAIGDKRQRERKRGLGSRETREGKLVLSPSEFFSSCRKSEKLDPELSSFFRFHSAVCFFPPFSLSFRPESREGKFGWRSLFSFCYSVHYLNRKKM